MHGNSIMKHFIFLCKSDEVLANTIENKLFWPKKILNDNLYRVSQNSVSHEIVPMEENFI